MRSLGFVGLLLVVGCGGPSGKISGRVTVEGGSAAGIALEAIGPTSTAAVTDESGTFVLEALKDGWYVVRARVAAAEVPEQQAVVRVQYGKADAEANLSFRIAAGTARGTVSFSDMSDASGIGVTLSGTANRGTVTGAGGAFSFKDLPQGSYVLTADVLDTRERHISVTFTLDAAMASVSALDLKFTAVGRITGTVKDAAMMPAANVEVVVPGSDVRALTDAAGAFELPAVLAGMRTVLARRDGAIPELATAMVTVARGANAPVDLALSAAMLPTGRVTGSVTYFGSQYANTITVSALGSDASTMVSPQGNYALDVPIGTWDIVADAPGFPRLVLGHLTVKEGTTQQLPPANMTLYRRFHTDPNFTGVIPLATDSESDLFVMIVVQGATRYNYVANAKTLARRLFHIGPISTPVISRTGRYLAYAVGGGVYVVDLSTGMQFAITRNSAFFDFSTDESTVFISELGTRTTRYKLATGAVTDFPNAGVAVRQNRDRWLLHDGASRTVTLVTPTTENVAFDQVDSFSVASTVPWARTACAGLPLSCTIKVLPRGATQAVIVQGGQYTNGSFVGMTGWGSGDWATFNDGFAYKLVKLTDGSVINLPSMTLRVSFSESGSRVAYISAGAGTDVLLRDEAVPPTGSSVPVATMPSTSFGFLWLSDTRLELFDNTAGAPRRIDVRAGVATVDTNYVANTGLLTGTLAVWGKSMDMKYGAIVADSPLFPIDIPVSSGVAVASGNEPNGPGRWAAISEGLATQFRSTFVIDGVRADMHTVPQYRVSLAPGGGGRAWPAAHAFSGEQLYVTFAGDQPFGLSEPGLTLLSISAHTGGNWAFGIEDSGLPTARVVIAEVPFP